ncbi:MAG: hypothetical protein FWG71_03330 [Synergistaceae bacterium]|nr:hypothetical protein [Synergistaceae bacterium]
MCVPYGRRCAGHGLPDTLEALQTHNIRLRRPIKKPFESFNTIGKTMMVTDERRPTNYQKVHFLIANLSFERIAYKSTNFNTLSKKFLKNNFCKGKIIVVRPQPFLVNERKIVRKISKISRISLKNFPQTHPRETIKKCTF